MKDWFKALIIRRLYVVAVIAFSCQSITENVLGNFDHHPNLGELPSDYMYTLSLEEVMDLTISKR